MKEVNETNKKEIAKYSAISITIVCMVFTSIIVYGALTVERTMPASATLAKIGVELYTDASCTTVVTSLDFGVVYPSTPEEKNMYIKNTGTLDVTLSMTVSGWTSGSSDVSLSWDCDGATLSGGTSIPCTVTLTPVAVFTDDGFSCLVTFRGDEITSP